MARVRFTYEDYRKLDDGLDYELIEGELVLSPSPRPYHQLVLTRIAQLLANHLDARPELGHVFVELDVKLAEDCVLRPDVTFLSRERARVYNLDENIEGAPDLVVEVRSPSTSSTTLDRKMRLYERFGVREAWLVDTEARAIEVFSFETGERLVKTGRESFRSRPLDAKFCVAAFFPERL